MINLPQEIINQFKNNEVHRTKNKSGATKRIEVNSQVKDLVKELEDK